MKRKPALLSSLLLILVMSPSRGQTLKCQRSEYQTGSVCCPMCPAGCRVQTDCNKYYSTYCLPCTEGTFMNQPTRIKQCFPCANCDEGSGLKRIMSCTTTSDSVCEPLEGFFCLDPTEDGCVAAQEHTRCKPGQYIRHKGKNQRRCSDLEGQKCEESCSFCQDRTAQRDTECSDCSEGEYSDGTFTSCRPHTQCEPLNLHLIKPGTVSTDAECGEQTADRRGVVVGAVLSILMIVAAAVLVVMFLHRKKIRCLNTEKKIHSEHGKPDDLKMEEGERLHQQQQDET